MTILPSINMSVAFSIRESKVATLNFNCQPFVADQIIKPFYNTASITVHKTGIWRLQKWQLSKKYLLLPEKRQMNFVVAFWSRFHRELGDKLAQKMPVPLPQLASVFNSKHISIPCILDLSVGFHFGEAIFKYFCFSGNFFWFLSLLGRKTMFLLALSGHFS